MDPTLGRDAFDVLGLSPSFELTREAIERAFLARSRAIHPDLVGANADAQAAAQASTAELNRAARTLRDPESRAIALLERLGGPSKEADKSLPEGFLQEILDVRMEIEASRGDAAERERWERWAVEQRAGCAARCAALFRGVGDPPALEVRREIRRTLNAWRYVERLIEQLDPEYEPARADFKA